MRTTEIYSKLGSIFKEVFDNEMIKPHAEMTAADVENWDSLSNIIMVVAVEEAFGIGFNTAEITQLKNVGELVSVIESKLKEKAA